MAQNEALFKKIEAIKTDSKEAKKVLEHEVRGFVLSGVNLPEDKKKRMEEISLKLSELSNQFSQNLLDATNAYELIIEDAKDVEGMPQSDIDHYSISELDGPVVTSASVASASEVTVIDGRVHWAETSGYRVIVRNAGGEVISFANRSGSHLPVDAKSVELVGPGTMLQPTPQFKHILD